MKRINLIINVLLALAVAVLYFLHFSTGKESVTAETEIAVQDSVSFKDGDLPIAFVQIDTLIQNMRMADDLNEKIQNKQQKAEADFASQQKSFEKQVADAQEKVQKGLVTRREAQELEAQLANKNAELQNNYNNYRMEIQDEFMVSNNKIINYIMEYLEDYNADSRFKYIMSYQFGGGLLYANKGLDITNDVLKGINEKYAAEKEK